MADGSSHFTQARIAGLSPIPVDTQSKRPLVRWASNQQRIADELVCSEWDEAGHNIGIVCGEVSGRLLCLDFEGSFFDRAIYLDTAAHEILTRWSRGYRESTPNGGQHILVRLEGEGPTEGNRKLAMGRDGKVLVETRGEGGYVIVAPSMNGARGWSLLRGGFDTIEYATLDEWEVVAAALARFDETPPPLTPLPTSTPSAIPILRLGESWIASVLPSLPPIEQILTANGWQQARSRDSYGQHWTRPGKDPREGHSASVSEQGRLWVHSSSAAPLPVGVSLDAADVILCYQLGRQPSLDERTVFLRSLRPAHPGGWVGGRAEPDEPASDSVQLDDWFWQSSDVLKAVHAAARGRMLAPMGVLGAYLSAYATTVPMNIWVPPIVGRQSPLNLYCCLVGRSGSGKSAAMGVAEELLGWNVNTNPHVLLGQSLRSGEGLPRLVIIPAKRGSDEEVRYHNAVQVEFDEGGTLGKQSERAGSTTIPYLNTAWSGRGTVGGAKAGEIVQFPAGFVRICCVMGVQYGAAGNLFTGEAAKLGFPQRLLYFELSDPTLAEVDVDSFGDTVIEPVPVQFWDHSEFSRTRMNMNIPPQIQREVKLWSQQTQHGTGLDDPLDGHIMLLRLRLASLFALMDKRGTVDDQDWWLSAQLISASRQTRSRLVQSMSYAERERKEARKMEAIELDDARLLHRIEGIALRVVRQLRKEDGQNWRQLRDTCFTREERPLRPEVFAYAEHRGWVIHRDDRYWRVGEVGEA